MKRKKINIADITIGDGYKVPFIAEIGVNHLGNFERAKKMVDDAIDGGADFIKFQTYVAEKRYDKKNPKYNEFTNLVKKWQFSKSVEKDLWVYAQKKGARVFTSVYDEESIEFANSLGTLAFKVAAFELNNKKLVEKIIDCKKPIIISCGMTNFDEVDMLVNLLEEHKAEYMLLHTVSSYPLEEKNSSLFKIRELRDRYNCVIGHSDHTPGTNIPILAAAVGANIIEKHFTDNPKHRLSDNFFSITKEQLIKIKFDLDYLYNILYSPSFKDDDPEKFMRDFKKIS